jgi:putative transposase
MPKKTFTAEQIVAKLRQIEVLMGQGKTVSQASKEAGITDQTFYRWRKEYGGEAARTADATRASRSERSRPLHPQSRIGVLLGDAPYVECSQSSPVVHYFQWNIDSNSNNGPRLP